MKLALGILRLKPAGGLERHALRIAGALAERGHDICLHTTIASDAVPSGVRIATLPRRSRTNHGAMAEFSQQFGAAAAGADVRVGFQRLAQLDVLFCADWCYADRTQPFWKRWLPRYRTLSRLEQACFDPTSATRIIALSAPQLDAYVGAYATPADRAVVLPPTIDAAHRSHENASATQRQAARAKLGLPDNATVWLWIGLQPHVKGLDRVIAALGRHPDAILVICGTSAGDKRVASLVAQADRAHGAGRVQVLGVVTDDMLAAAFGAADLLVHPARLDVTGTVILEAMAAGLPVVTTANCGFAPHVASADAGLVVPVPFDQQQFEAALGSTNADRRRHWAKNAIAYCANPRLYSGIEHACNLIEAAAKGPAAWREAAAEAQAPRPVPQP
jgi:UDP-glucose:(heptosyl)LPS alpha-1,3-glucosyltransferase